MTAEQPRPAKPDFSSSLPGRPHTSARPDDTPPCRCGVKVLLVDNHVFIRSGLKLLIESRPGMRVVGAESDCRSGCAHVEQEPPDVILINLEPGEESRLPCVPALLGSYPEARVLIISDIRRPEFYAECMRAGASGVVTKEAAPEVFFKAIEKVSAGELWFERSALGAVLSAMARGDAQRPDPDESKIASLTARELEVIELVGMGLKNKQIADRLFICEATVSHHLTSIFSKLELADRLALVIFAYQHGLARLPGNGN